jgi:hypothetical protein
LTKVFDSSKDKINEYAKTFKKRREIPLTKGHLTRSDKEYREHLLFFFFISHIW